MGFLHQEELVEAVRGAAEAALLASNTKRTYTQVRPWHARGPGKPRHVTGLACAVARPLFPPQGGHALGAVGIQLGGSLRLQPPSQTSISPGLA